MFIDSHIHLAECENSDLLLTDKNWYVFSCSKEIKEFEKAERFAHNNSRIKLAYSPHPQEFMQQNSQQNMQTQIETVKKLLEEKRIHAIGECGFDMYPPYKETIRDQEILFKTLTELAVTYKVPVVIHDRKGIDYLFRYVDILKDVPSILMHSFFYNSTQAYSILNKGINVYFSFGMPLLNNSKKAVDCITHLPLERIFLETDAPFQCPPQQIKDIYAHTAALVNLSQDELKSQLLKNWQSFFPSP